MLDTNVIISIIIFNSKSLKKLLEMIIDKYELVLCSYVLDELREVVKRKFDNKVTYLDEFLYNLPYELYVTPSIIPNDYFDNIRDINDLPILYSSIKSQVDILITGDKDFANINVQKPKIMTPSEFLNKYL